ncbi:pantetheine-phosphate adenylyltransferase [Campylobacter upsaliensis]|uniref:Phosphopantetheine adenylyltransferase n=1 Tax=Campylobacter upsaliensis JV21 TaxID=888826 RepID=A0A828QX55_CAMUP|nr:pantetheine-phosphate adenylyltransferase [Campylobacter upsaliensis]EAH6228043.1 pantetheine-phosphate adenylyltransferase [Campylobacter upsaliensis]EAH6863706.1 pantetheine-phosphate adenylyltransferase [Campylobacter upsaliensis]EAH7072170.1 pantetheine-phosphate adenylyltransferase [Campylobacter upsaliensis]EAH7701026.1 pantetheine-phosphate adenylyltransferase [Campylobacter upsaliensis]EAH8308850.1 pantetheine-phosphate adenylyltransferase [Campylobacter upsaliensis]
MTCLYPGSFDPITNGHLDVIKRALKIFDKVIVAIAQSEHKNPCFSLEKRKDLALLATQNLKNVEIVTFTNLLVDLAKELEIKTVIRGLRAVSDFEYELQIGYANNALWSEFETVYLMPNLKNAFISSSIVRSIAAHGGDVSSLVPKEILPFLKDSSCM